MFKRKVHPFRVWMRAALPLVIILALTTVMLGYYCWRTTKSAITPPYQVYEERYTSVPLMMWQHMRAQPHYRHSVLAKFEADQEATLYRSYFKLSGQLFRIYSAGVFFFGPILILPFLVLFVALQKNFSIAQISERSRALLILGTFFIVGTEASIFYNPHYSAPAASLILAMILTAIRRVRNWTLFGKFLSRAILVGCGISFAVCSVAEPLHIPADHASTYYRFQFFRYKPRDWFPRAKIEKLLEDTSGNHIVIVRYSPEHQPFPDWVYNRADIDRSRVIWARDMSPHENQELQNYYKDRVPWLLEPDAAPPRLTRIPQNQY
jgi:multisubunit Na+/H+ antiporter MnhB subunit